MTQIWNHAAKLKFFYKIEIMPQKFKLCRNIEIMPQNWNYAKNWNCATTLILSGKIETKQQNWNYAKKLCITQNWNYATKSKENLQLQL